MKNAVRDIVNTSRLPFFDFVLVVMVVIPQVDTGDTTGVMLSALLFINHGIAKTKYRTLEEALVNPQLHASLALFGSPAVVGFRWGIIPNNIRVQEAIADV
jgi:hypothetical protein